MCDRVGCQTVQNGIQLAASGPQEHGQGHRSA